MALNLQAETVFTCDSVSVQPPLPLEEIAPHFPQLEIVECLGRGGMGVVYKARQKTLNRPVALKLLAPERVSDAKFAERFTREAQALAALNHPNIVTIHDFGQAGGFYFLLMEFVDGVNLRRLLRTRKFTPEEALAIVPPLCDALQFAHERGIVHRDIKPENLLLDKTGRVKIADFGIAKMLGPTNVDGSPVEGIALEGATQSVVGTRGYNAPEQETAPQRVDSRADIYSLGVVFYEILTGELPGKRIEPPSRKVQIDVRLDEIVLRALEKSPERRWQTADELRTQVETIAATAIAEDGRRDEVRDTPGAHLRRLNTRQIFARGLLVAVLALLSIFAGTAVFKSLRTHAPVQKQFLARVPNGRIRELLTAMEARVQFVQKAAASNGMLEMPDVFNQLNEYCDELQWKNQNSTPIILKWGISDSDRFRQMMDVLAGMENDTEEMRDIAQGRSETGAKRTPLLKQIWRERFMTKYEQFAALLASDTSQSPLASADSGENPTEQEIRSVDFEEWFNRIGQEFKIGLPPFTAMEALQQKAKEGDDLRLAIIHLASKIIDDAGENFAKRWQCCYVLSGIGDERGIPAIARALKNKNETIRGVAACALGAFEHSDARAALEAAAKSESNAEVQGWIQKALKGEFLRKNNPQQGGISNPVALGQVMHRTIYDTDGIRTNASMIDLDSGTVFSESEIGPESSAERFIAAFEHGLRQMRKEGVDLCGDTSGKSFSGFDMIIVPAKQTFDLVTSESTASDPRLTARAETQLNITVQDVPATYLFKTREGGRGVLEVIRFSTNLESIDFRYKLFQAKVRQATGPSERPIAQE